MKFIFPLLILAFCSCDDFISINISDKTPVIITPQMEDTLQESPVTIKWENLTGATKYRLQVVSPSFDHIEHYVLDTIVYNNYFVSQLDSSEYELSLTAYNSGYTSKTLGPVKFYVGVNPAVIEHKVELISPSDSLYTKPLFNSNFSWNPFNDAQSYEFSFRRGANFSTSEILTTINNIVTNTINLPSNISLNEGVYCWGVKAYTSSSETIYSTHKIFVDVTNPNIPSLISPTNLTTQNSGLISFNWSSGLDQGTIKSPIQSTLEISSDLLFNTIVFSDDLSQNTAQVTLTSGTYYWRVLNFDAAGNYSQYSGISTLILN